jgi:hypothetical protein
MRTFLSNTLAALAKNPPKLAPVPEAPPPLLRAQPNRRQRRQQELGQRRAQARTNRALEQALVTPKKTDTMTITGADGQQYEAVLGIDKGIGPDRTMVVTQNDGGHPGR